MIKKTEENLQESLKHTKKEIRILESLKKRFLRDEQKYKFRRCVYSYYDRFSNSYTDNLILLPYSTRHSHEVFLTNCLYQVYSNFSKEAKIKLSEVAMMTDIHFIGYFDIDKHSFEKKSKKVIVSGKDIEELLKNSRS